MKHRLALIVPTRNRPVLLDLMLATLERQTRKPDQVLVVDGSDEPLEGRLRTYDLPLQYVRVFPPSLTKQRNAGRRAVASEMTLVGYLDDDLELEPDAIEVLMRYWEEKATDRLGGTSFNIVNAPYRPPTWLYRLFGIESERQGVILRSGYATSVEAKDEATRSEWLCGGATVWRRDILEQFEYDEWFAGAANYEDADLSYRAGRISELVVLRDARVDHNPPPLDPKKMKRYGEMHQTYRWYFVKKHFGRTFPRYYLATAGAITSAAVSALIRWDRAAMYSAMGGLVGLAKVLTGRASGIHSEFRQAESPGAAKTAGGEAGTAAGKDAG